MRRWRVPRAVDGSESWRRRGLNAGPAARAHKLLVSKPPSIMPSGSEVLALLVPGLWPRGFEVELHAGRQGCALWC